MTKLHVIILTLNEEEHIARCINSVKNSANSILVVDSGSTDKTKEIATSLGAKVVFNKWVNHAKQLQFGIELLRDEGGWILRVDADEVVSTRGPNTLESIVANVRPQINGILVRRRIHFLGSRIRHGAIEPSWQLRLFRNGYGECEQRWMDEHIVVKGGIEKSNIVISDINLKPITWWIEKHNSYASREAIEVLNKKYQFFPTVALINQRASRQAKIRRFAKEHIYGRISSGIRAWLYFLYRFVFRLGFLDGAAGFYYHSFQGLWYRSLVDAKIKEIELFAQIHDLPIADAVIDRTGIDPRNA